MTKNMTLRLSEDLHKVLRLEAAEKGASLHEYILGCLQGRPPLEAVIDPPADDPAVTHQANTHPLVESGLDLRRAPPRPTTGGPSCTCPQAERRKGKHNKWCPAKV